MQLKTNSGTEVSLSSETFARDFNEGLVHQAVVSYMSGSRAGTKAQKNRSLARGGGAKPWRQKGAGRARVGTSRSPIWRSGGVTFAARPRNYEQKMNRKQYRAAMQCILSELARQRRLVLIDDLKVEDAKTRVMVAKIRGLDLDNVLIVTEEIDENLYLSVRNIPCVGICDVAVLDPESLVRFEKVLMTVGAVRKIEEWLG